MKGFCISGFLFFSLFIIVSCEDILEVDLTKKSVNLISPSDSVVINSEDITFFWDDLEGGEEYILQIVSPSFNEVQHFILDTTLTKNSFSYSLNDGYYEWRLKAINSGYETSFQYSSFLINLNNESLNLLYPEDNFITGNENVYFKWEPIEGAKHYIFQILENDDFTKITTSTSLTIPISLYDSLLSWRITAVNEESNLLISSEIYQLNIDKTPPSDVVVLSPEDNSIFSIDDEIALSWSNVDDKDFDSYLVYVMDSELNIYPGFPKETKTNSYLLTDGNFELETGVYKWKILSKDKYGNISNANNASVRILNIE